MSKHFTLMNTHFTCNTGPGPLFVWISMLKITFFSLINHNHHAFSAIFILGKTLEAI